MKIPNLPIHNYEDTKLELILEAAHKMAHSLVQSIKLQLSKHCCASVKAGSTHLSQGICSCLLSVVMSSSGHE